MSSITKVGTGSKKHCERGEVGPWGLPPSSEHYFQDLHASLDLPVLTTCMISNSDNQNMKLGYLYPTLKEG